MDLLRETQIKLAVNPLGGAGVHYWGPIAESYGLNLTVLDTRVDPRFQFVNKDWDGKIRMDPSSPYVMDSLVKNQQTYEVSFACDTDDDRHSIVTRSAGLMPPNDYLSTAAYYLLLHRPLLIRIDEYRCKFVQLSRIGQKLCYRRIRLRRHEKMNCKPFASCLKNRHIDSQELRGI